MEATPSTTPTVTRPPHTATAGDQSSRPVAQGLTPIARHVYPPGTTTYYEQPSRPAVQLQSPTQYLPAYIPLNPNNLPLRCRGYFSQWSPPLFQPYLAQSAQQYPSLQNDGGPRLIAHQQQVSPSFSQYTLPSFPRAIASKF